MLSVEGLHVSYDKVEAVRGVTLEVLPGEVTLILGANGAGKTTTLRAICGLMKPGSGKVMLDGKDITGTAAHKVVRKGMVLVPEGRRVFAPLTVLENLRLGGYAANRSTTTERLEQVYDMFPILKTRSSGQAGLLSGGEQQMLAFGRALMSEPRVMLMDEPSMGLAPAVVDIVLGSVRKIADAGIGILMVEQNADAGLESADHVVVMTRGEVAFTGSVEVARSHTAVVHAFLGEAALAGPS
ncbi:MAG: ABC-type branched-chain amino acid transport system ATPase component [Pseudonocardiales bacterium]|nr:ABC-type branched-chain amino acid transport system ATPase component [Pseudonocardiales bacterium]